MAQSPRPLLRALDHLVLTVADIAATCQFYQDVLGMTAERFTTADGTQRMALKYGQQKINLHQAGHEFEPKADSPTPGSADMCFLTDASPEAWLAHLRQSGVEVEEGPVLRTGATGPLFSIYVRDPDRNLIEISTPA